MTFLISMGLFITIAPFLIRRKYLTVKADLEKIELRYLEGNIFFLEKKTTLYGLKNGSLYYYSQKRRSWELHPSNFNPFILHANKYNVKILDQEHLPKRYKRNFLFKKLDN